MVSHIAYFEYIVTDSEMEALLLECNLIKEHRPKYNVMLKDDKTYPYIKVTTNEEFPRIFITRKYVKDKNRYFGPITDATASKETVELINKLFPIRKCKKKFPRDIGKERPCLNLSLIHIWIWRYVCRRKHDISKYLSDYGKSWNNWLPQL